MDEWVETTIGDQATLQRGFDITKAQQCSGGIPVVSSGGISSYHNQKMVEGPGVILGRKGVVGSVYFISNDYWPHDTTLWVKDFHGNNQRFVYYFFKWLAPRLANMDVGSANPTLNRNHVHPIKVFWPEIHLQKCISDLLTTLDDKIDLNRRVNETLEAMARAIFKDWFVDFGPVRAKAEGCPSYLAPEIWELFPDTLDDEDKPVGWSREPIGQFLSTLETGKRPRGGVSNILKGLPSVGAESIERVGLFDFGKTKYVPQDFYNKMNKGIVSNGDVLIYKDGGKPGELRPAVTYTSDGFPFDEFCINEHVFRVRTNRFSQQFLYCALSTEDAFWQMREMATGVAQPGLNQAAINAIQITVPNDDRLLRACEQLIDANIDACNFWANESRTLAQLRDLLLPKLMSGEIRLRDAEKRVEAVA